MTNDKIEVQIENPEWRELNGYRFYLTRELYERLSVETGQEGETRLSLLKKGKLTKGFKHLLFYFNESLISSANFLSLFS